MTMPPPPQQPPGPHRARPPEPYQPQPPGPYGPPQQPGFPPAGPPGTAFPHQAPGPYGGPRPGWGTPPPGRRRRAGLVAGIVAGAFALLGVLGFAAKTLLDSAGATTPLPAATHRLTVPPTLADGEYRLTQDLSGTEGRRMLQGTYSGDFRVTGPAVGQYSTAPDSGVTGVLVVSGAYGQVRYPDTERGSALRGAATADGAHIAVPARDMTPAGAEVKVECQVLATTDGGTTGNFPMCAWGDDNTVGTVALVDVAKIGQKPEEVDLAAAAELTVTVRSEMRKPIG